MGEKVSRIRKKLQERFYHMNDTWLEDCLDYYYSENREASDEETLTFVTAQWQLSDLRDISNQKGCLPGNLCQLKSTLLPGKYILQVEEAYDIATSKYRQLESIRKVSNENIGVTETERTESEVKSKRMMELSLTDGIQDVKGIEYKPIGFLKDVVLPGFKMMIKGPVQCRRGVILLTESSLEDVGGEVEQLLIKNAKENVLARALGLEENPNPYGDESPAAAVPQEQGLFEEDFDVNFDELSELESRTGNRSINGRSASGARVSMTPVDKQRTVDLPVCFEKEEEVEMPEFSDEEDFGKFKVPGIPKKDDGRTVAASTSSARMDNDLILIEDKKLDVDLENVEWDDFELEEETQRVIAQSMNTGQKIQAEKSAGRRGNDAIGLANVSKKTSGRSESRGAAYGDLGRVHAALGNHEQAVSCLSHQLALARGLGNKAAEAEAASGLGAVHLLMNDPTAALRHHQLELTIAEELDAAGLQARACANLGTTQEALGQLEEAVRLQEQSLSLAAAAGDQPARAAAFSSLGRLHHLRGDVARALSYLQSGLSLSEALGRREEVAKLRHRLGLVHWQAGEPSIAVEQLEKAANLLESLDSNSMNNQTKHGNLLNEIYGTLQKVLVGLNRAEEALNWAERSRRTKTNSIDDVTHYSEIIDRQRGIVLYYSEVGEELHAWCLAPTRGLLRFHTVKLENGLDLEKQVISAREALLGESGDIIDESTKMPTRGHHLNASSYSLSSLFSVGSASSRAGSARWGRGTKGPIWQAPASIQSLYDLLLAPFEDLLPSVRKELILVVEKSLYLAPLPALQSGPGEDYLCERFSLLVVPSLAALKKRSKAPMPEGGATVAALIVGNPVVPEDVREVNGWPESASSAETEAAIVAELLESRALTGPDATRSSVIRSLPDAECVHLTTPITWPSASLALTPDQNDESSERPEYLISSSDIMRLRLTARLVVLSSGHCWSNDDTAKVTSDGVQSVAKSFLSAGAQCVLVAMWPVPSTAGSILLRAFYSALLQGARASRALAEAMQTVQHTRHFAHPANWAGWLLLGGDTRLSNKVALMGQALAELLRSGPEQCRDALRVTLHLVEKSLQRIHRGQKNAMYTTQRSIENKVGSATGWKELLMSVGFRFEPAGNGIPSSVFFPQSDPEERLTRCSASLQALLGLGPASLQALIRLLQAPEVAEDVIAAMRKASSATEGQEVTLPVPVWRASGSHELFASLGMDLMEVGQSEVTLRTGKQASRRAVQFALQALLALFDTQEAPKSLSLDSGSSMESLASVQQSEKNGLLEGPRLGGAFASYVRHRGEPDGKTTEPPSGPLSRQSYPNQGGESDVAFTPSPPVALTLNHQTRIRSLYQDQAVRPDSSSSSSVTDWENGHNTILRRQPLPPIPPTVLERLSVRTELGATTARKLRLPGSSEEINQADSSQANEAIPHMRNLTNSLTGLTRELTPTISDVYHERNLGLGLAPSLSKLLEEVGNVTESEQRQLSRSETSQTQNWLQNEPELCRRDEADGRSIAESQCSATSSNKIHRKAPPPPV